MQIAKKLGQPLVCPVCKTNKKMKKYITVAAVFSLFIFSCSKKIDSLPPTIPASEIMNPALGSGGDDDEPPIFMEKAVTASNSPLGGTHVAAISGTDTISGMTNSAGLCTLTLSHFGEWNLIIFHTEYAGINTSVNIVDSLTQRIDTLQ